MRPLLICACLFGSTAHADAWLVGADADLGVPLTGEASLTNGYDNIPFAWQVRLRGGRGFELRPALVLSAHGTVGVVRNEPGGTSQVTTGWLGLVGTELAYGTNIRGKLALELGYAHFVNAGDENAGQPGDSLEIVQSGFALVIGGAVDFRLGRRVRLGVRLSWSRVGGQAEDRRVGATEVLGDEPITWITLGPTLTVEL